MYMKVLLYNFPLPGFQCYCNQVYSTSCIDEPIITCPGEFNACYVAIESQLGTTFLNQGCVDTLFNYLLCQEELDISIGSLVPYHYCCKEELCNAEEVLLQLINATANGKDTLLLSEIDPWLIFSRLHSLCVFSKEGSKAAV